jgi:hypothetical protein
MGYVETQAVCPGVFKISLGREGCVLWGEVGGCQGGHSRVGSWFSSQYEAL